MKELEIRKIDLTKQPQTPYSKGGDNFMAEPGNGEAQQPQKPQEGGQKPAEKTEQKPQEVSPERIEAARKAWNEANRERTPLSVDERRIQEELIKLGKGPIAGGAGQGGEPPKEPPAPPTGEPEDHYQQSESQKNEKSQSEEAEEAYLINEKDIENDSLKSHVQELNEFITRVVLRRDTRGWKELRKKLGELEPPAGLTREQRQRFNLDKAKLLGAMAEAIRTISPQQAELENKYSELETAIRAGDCDAVDRIINGIDIDDYNMYAPVIRKAIDEIRGYDYMLEYLLEYGVERILNIADVNPKVQYPQFNLYQTQNLDSVTQAARFYDERRGDQSNRMFKYLTDLRSKRYAMHELARSMKSRENYVRLVTELLRQDGLAFVEKEIAGVSDVQIAYEKILGSRLSLKEESWLTNEDFAEADEEVGKFLDESVNTDTDVLKKKYIKNGEVVSRPLRAWEIKRARLVGRSLNSASQRRIIYAILGDVPTDDTDTFLKSVESEFIARILAPMKLFPERFFGWPMGKRFMELYVKHQKKIQEKAKAKDPRKYGYEENGKEAGLYGKKSSVFAILDTGVVDPKSNSWRGRLMFLRQKDYRTITMSGEAKESIGEYLRLTKIAIKNEIKKKVSKGKPKLSEKEIDKLMNEEKYGYKEKLNDKYNKKVRGVIANQRLFLGVLLHNFTDLDIKNRTAIWKNTLRFLPSRIAAFFPKQMQKIVKTRYGLTSDKEAMDRWNKIKSKLFLAEIARVKSDGESLREKGEGNAEISDYFDKLKIDSVERMVIKDLQNLQINGESAAKALAMIKFPFTPFLDDVPKTDWENLADEDFDRILINDQSAFAEGYEGIINLIAKPEVKPDQVIETFAKSFEKIASPMGQPEARVKLHSVINAYLEMARMNALAKWFGWIMKLTRSPRSEIEKFNLQARIAEEETEQSDILRGLAQQGVVSDDPVEADENGKTQFMRMKEENDADVRALIYNYFRIIVMLFGVEFAKSFLKTLLPGDLSKSMGL